MSDRETSLLRPRLERLADELTPSPDPVAYTDAARTRYRRQRRVRTAVVGVATAAVLLGIGVPLTLSSLASPPGEVAGPSQTTAEPTTARDRDQIVIANEGADQVLEQRVLDQFAQDAIELQGAFTGRPAPLSLTAPADLTPCPEIADLLSERLNTSVQASGGARPDGPPGCQWSTDSPEPWLVVGMAFRPGVTEEQMRTEVNQDRVNLDCYPAAMPQAPPTPVLSICRDDGLEVWYMNVPVADGSGTWVLTVTADKGYVGVGRAAAMGALMDVADVTW